MSEFIIQGGKALFGELSVQGAKNSALPILGACVLCGEEIILQDCPKLSDTYTAFDILKDLGCDAYYENDVVKINCANITGYEITDKLMREMRSSLMFLGPILGRWHKAKISMPGGCNLGPRRIDLHISALEKMGVKFTCEKGYFICEAPDGINGANINLSYPSVGATENIMTAAVLSKGETILSNAAKEPEIADLQNFLNSMGANISGAGTDNIRIKGVKKLKGITHKIIPDRIAAATYINAIIATGGEGIVKNVHPPHLTAFLAALSDADCRLNWTDDIIYIKKTPKLKPVEIITMPYPGFPTDAQSIMMALMCTAAGNKSSSFNETIFEARYNHVDELIRMGAKIHVNGSTAVVDGVEKLSGASVRADDLRGGAALIIAGLAAEGETKIQNIFHIERGYDIIDVHLRELGANIIRM